MTKSDMIDYRGLRLNNITSPQYSHLLYSLFWPVYGFLFLAVERFWVRESYFPMHCALDDMIPFCEFFLIPYLLWFALLAAAVVFTLLYDAEGFKRLMKFIIISYSIAIIVYLIFPNCQELRPAEFVRDNIFTKAMALFYTMDTSTNVCPSIHVIGSVAVMLCAWDSKRFSSVGSKIAFAFIALLISVSTLFLKQHSAIDVLCAIPVSIIAYLFSYLPKRKSV